MKTHPHKIYQREFEIYYLKATTDYYAIESSNYIADYGVPMYLKKYDIPPTVFFFFLSHILGHKRGY